jgi:hypothetical protein
MPALELTDIAAWTLIVGGTAYAALASHGSVLAVVAAAVAAFFTKAFLFELS